MTASPTEKAQTVADNFEQKVKDKQGLTDVFAEINSNRRDGNFIKAVNDRFKSNGIDVPGLQGFEIVDSLDNNNQQVTLKNEKGAYIQYNADGSRVEIWGNPKHDREFSINDDGTATHKVRPGENVWRIAKDIIRAQKGDPTYRPDNKEVLAMIEKLKEANPKLKENADLIQPGQEIIVPQDVVKGIQEKRQAAESGDDPPPPTDKPQEVRRQDGTAATIERDSNNKPIKITERDKEGRETVYEKRGEQWFVKTPGGQEKPYGGTIDVKPNGTIMKWEGGYLTVTYPNGTVGVRSTPPRVEEMRITTTDGTTYEYKNKQWFKKNRDGGSEGIDGEVSVDENGNVNVKAAPGSNVFRPRRVFGPTP